MVRIMTSAKCSSNGIDSPIYVPWRQGIYALPHAIAYGQGGQYLGYEGELCHFANCIRTGQEPRSPLYDGAAALAIAEAI
jgi:hypothetical protein